MRTNLLACAAIRLNECGAAFRSAVAASATAILLATTGTAVAQQPAPQGAAMAGELVTAQATVQSVDLAKRTITLKTTEGRTHTLQVGEQVKNLTEVKPGDVVKVAFYQAVAVDLRKPSAGASGVTVAEEVARAKPSTLPAGAVAEQVTFTSEIVGIEPAENQIIVIAPDGNVRTIKVKDPKNQALLPSLQLGEKIGVTMTEGLAVAVDRVK